MTLDSVSINGAQLDASAYERTPDKLTIKSCPTGDFDLEIVTTIKPQENTLLEGLYKSGGNYCSQVGIVERIACVSRLSPALIYASMGVLWLPQDCGTVQGRSRTSRSCIQSAATVPFFQ
jgi:hypothetical protein